MGRARRWRFGGFSYRLGAVEPFHSPLDHHRQASERCAQGAQVGEQSKLKRIAREMEGALRNDCADGKRKGSEHEPDPAANVDA